MLNFTQLLSGGEGLALWSIGAQLSFNQHNHVLEMKEGSNSIPLGRSLEMLDIEAEAYRRRRGSDQKWIHHHRELVTDGEWFGLDNHGLEWYRYTSEMKHPYPFYYTSSSTKDLVGSMFSLIRAILRIIFGKRSSA